MSVVVIEGATCPRCGHRLVIRSSAGRIECASWVCELRAFHHALKGETMHPTRDTWRDLVRRLGAVAAAAEDYRMSNDVSDELHEALDALRRDDIARATAPASDDEGDGR